MRLFVAAIPLVTLSIGLMAGLPTRSAGADHNVVFADDVAPIFQRRCVACHNDDERHGELSLQSATSLAHGGESGKVIVPGQPDASYLVELITPRNGSADMPKDADPLSDVEVEKIKAWIKDGAVWPDGLQVEAERIADVDWWSWLPLTLTEFPKLNESDMNWVRTPVDAFVLAKLREQGLSPSPEADRRTLIRRLYFDLIGLPPSADEVDEFISDSNPRAYARLVDRLLESPRYGERWARHWLDVVHYGDTHGYDKDKPRPNAWPYRDYVIRAFSDDLPYDQFIREQIAGDVLSPQDPDGIVATGFIAAGPWDFISHVEVPESKIDGQVARSLDRDDMVRVTMETFNSVTIGCARCHHHKFDPVSQEDYYNLQAVFAAVDRADRPFDQDPAVLQERRRLLARQESLQTEHESINQEIQRLAGDQLSSIDDELKSLESKSRTEARPEFGWHSAIESTNETTKWVQVDLGRPVSISNVVIVGCHDDFNGIGAGFGFPVRYRIELSNDPTFAVGHHVVVDHTSGDVANPGVEPQSFDVAGRASRFVRVTATRLATRKDDYIFALAELQVFDADGINVALGATVASLDSIEAPVRWSRKNLVDGYYFGQANDPAAQSRIDALHRQRDELITNTLTDEQSATKQSVERELAEVSTSLKQLPAPAMVYAAATDFAAQGNFKPTNGQAREIRVLKRGNVLTPGELAHPDALAALAPLVGSLDLPAESSDGERRIALATWLASKDNPLTWRSIVNRVWLYHFGRGIVDTPNDFGRMGQLPTHPELLDWLASQFRDGGMSIKQLHRVICNSATYRQSSAHRNECADVDADNRWLWRMNRRRLDAESIRDSVLLACGALDDKMYGPGFQDFVIEKPEHSPHYQYHLHDPSDPRSHRRSIYRFLVRSQQQPFMTALDCADPSMQVDKRNETVTPQQALALLNNQFMLVMAERLAGRVHAAGDNPRDQIAAAFRYALSRSPNDDELQAFTAFAEHHGLANACRVLLNLNEFVFVD